MPQEGPKRAPRGPKEGTRRSQNDPPDHKILSGFFDFSSHLNVQHQHHKSTSPLGVLGQKEGPNVSPKKPSNQKILSGFFVFAKALHFIRPTHTSTSLLLSQNPLNVFGCCLRTLFYKTNLYISISTLCSWSLNIVQKVRRESQSIGSVIRVLGSVAGSGAHAPLR